MPDTMEKRPNWALWAGFLLALGAMLCNAAFFLSLPGQRAIPWLSLLLAVFGLILLVMGLRHALFSSSQVYGGKIISSIVWVNFTEDLRVRARADEMLAAAKGLR